MTSNSGNECMMTAASTDLFSQLQRLRLSDGTSAGERIRTTVVTTPPAERNQLPRTMSITSSTSNGSGAATATTVAARHYSHDSLSVPLASPQSTLTLPEYTTYTQQHGNGGGNSREAAQAQRAHAQRSSSMRPQQPPQHQHDLRHESVSMPDLASLAMHVSNKQQQQQQQQQRAYDEDVSRRTMMSNNSITSGSNHNHNDVSSVASPLCSFAARNAYTLTHVPAPTQQQPPHAAFMPPAHVSSSGYASDVVAGSLADYRNNSYTVVHSPYASPQSSIPHLSTTQRPVSSPSLHTGPTLTVAPAPAGVAAATPRAPVAIAVEPLHPTVLQFLQSALPGTANSNKGNTTSASTTMSGTSDVGALVALASTLPATTMFARAPESVCASAAMQSGMSATASAVAAVVATTIARTSNNNNSNNNSNNSVTVDSQAATPTATVSPSTRDKRNKQKQQQQQQQQHDGVAYDKSSTLTVDAVRVDAVRTTAPRAVATVATQRADVNKARRSDSNSHNSHNEDDITPPLPPPAPSPQQKQKQQQQHDAALAMADDAGGSHSSSHSRSNSSSNGSSSGGGGGGTRRRRGSLDRGAAHTHMTVDAAIAANAFVCEALGCEWTDNTCARTPIIRTAPDVPHGGRYIVVGDVHGCVDQLEALVAKVKYVQGKDCLVIIGDYVNKGPDSVGVVRACQRLGALGVLGNHDYTLLRCCAQQRRKPFTPQELRDPVKQLARDFPRECEYYLRSLPHMLRLPAYGVLLVHAGVNPQYALEAQSIREIMHMRRLVPVSAASDEPTTTSSHGNNNNDNDNDNDDEDEAEGKSGGRAAGSSPATKAAHTRIREQHKDTTSHMRVTVGSGAAKKTMFVTTTAADATTTTTSTTVTTPTANATTTTTAATAATGVRYRVLEKGYEGTPWAELWSGPPHIVFGHDAYAGFQCHPHAYGIDTGCVYGDPLTCVVYHAAAPHGEFFSVPGLPRHSNERLGLPPPSADIYEQLQSSDVSRAIIRPTTSASLATTTTRTAATAATARCTPAAFLTTPPSTPALTSGGGGGGGGAAVASAHTFLATPRDAATTRAHGGHTVVVVGAGAARTTTTTTTTTAMAVAAATATGTRTEHGSTLHTPVLEGNTQVWRGMRLPSPATLPPSAVTSARGTSVTATQHNNSNYSSYNNCCAASPSSLMSGALDKAASISVREVQKATLLALSATHELRALVTVLMMPLYERHYDAMMQDDVDDKVAQQSFWCPFVQAVLEAVLQLSSSSSSSTSSSNKEHNDGCGGNTNCNAAGRHAAAMTPTRTTTAAAAAAVTTSSASTAPQTYVTALALMEECVDYVMHFVLPVCEAMRYVRVTARPQLRAVAADVTPGLWSRAVQKYVAMVLQQADEDDKDDDENDTKGGKGGGGDDNKDNKNKSSNSDGEATHTRRV